MEKKSKEELIDSVINQIIMDMDHDDYTALEELLGFTPNVNLIEYLPEEDWKQFKHLRDEKDNNS